MKKNKLKLIFILILAAFLFSCSKEVKKPAEEKKPVEVKVETVQQNEVKSELFAKTESPSKESQAKEEADLKTKNLTEKLAEESKTYLLRNLNGGPSSGFMSRSTPYRSNDEHYYKEGSLLFYNLNINDTYDEVVSKLRKFGVDGFYPASIIMPKELQELGCKAYIPDDSSYKRDLSNDFYIIFKDNKIIRFIKYQAEHTAFEKFYNAGTSNKLIIVDDMKTDSSGYDYYKKEMGGVIYHNQHYLPTALTTVVMTRVGYESYFEKADKIADEIFEFGDLYFYGLNIKDNIEIVKQKMNKFNVDYEDEFFSYHSTSVNLDDFIYALKTKKKSDWVACCGNKIVLLDVYTDEEDSYILMQYFKRKYPLISADDPFYYCCGTMMGPYIFILRRLEGYGSDRDEKDYLFSLNLVNAGIFNYGGSER